MKVLLLPVVVVLAVSACGSVNNALVEKNKSVEYYRIFDIKTTASRQAIAQAASDGLGRNTTGIEESMPIPASAEVPETAGRFQLVSPFKNTQIAALAGAAAMLKMATCDGASWIAQSKRTIDGGSNKMFGTMKDSNLRLTACLFPYKEGYHLDFYASFTKTEGGIFQISRSAAHALVGTPEEWTEKTFLDIVRSIRAKTGAEITLLEAQPEIVGTPWHDSGEDFKQ